MKRLALGPAVFVLALGASAQAQDGKAGNVYRAVASEEIRIAKAIEAGNSGSLQRSVGTLGHIIDDALARRQRGQSVTACDLAAHSLAYAAVSTAEALAHSKEERKMLLSDARAAAGDFVKDMQTCEKLTGHKIGNHASVGKALRAL